MVRIDDFSYGSFHSAYRTEHLYKEIYFVVDYKHNMSADKRGCFVNSSQYIVTSVSTILLIVDSILLMMANLRFAH